MSKVLFLLLILITLQTFGQSDFLKGEIIDALTNEPIAFATVAVKGKAVGVISNIDGSFIVPERFKGLGDTLRISSMGYEKREILISKLSSNIATRVYLRPSIFELEEAVVKAKRKRPLSARQIVRRAIEHIPKNYPFQSFSTIGYYRDYQLDSLGYLNLNEALLEVFDAGFDELDIEKTRTRIYDYAQNLNFRRDSLADDSYNYKDFRKIMDKAYLPAYGGNEFVILRVHDAVRNYRVNSFDYINNMSKGHILRHHGFKKLPDINSDEENLFKIQIIRTEPEFTTRGTIFVAKKDYAIHKLQYAVYDENKKNIDPLLQEKGINGKLVFEVTTAYKRGQEDKMFLNYISFHNTFRLAMPSKFAVKHLTVLPDKGAFAVQFNNALAHVGKSFGYDVARIGGARADSRHWYNFKYNEIKLKFKNIQIINDSTVYLYPKMDSIPLKNMMRELVTMKKENIDMGRALKFQVSGLEDRDGNALNVEDYKDYNQFREFFVQEINMNSPIPANSLIMDNRKPIFENQPMQKPDNFEDYWMNTPLQKSN